MVVSPWAHASAAARHRAAMLADLEARRAGLRTIVMQFRAAAAPKHIVGFPLLKPGWNA